MRKRVSIIFICSLFIFQISFSFANNKLGNINLPHVKSIELKNGLKVYFIGNELPQVSIVAYVGLGKIYESRANAGISNLISKTLSLAGCKKYPGQALHEKIDYIGGKLRISSGWEGFTISIKVLKRFSNEAFDIISDILLHPNFNSNDFATAQSLLVDEIKRSYDNPATIAFEKAREILFDGEGYGSVPTVEKVKSYTLENVNQVWKKHFTAKNILMGITSSVNFNSIKNKTKKFLGSLSKGDLINYHVDKKKINKIISKNKEKIFLYKKDIPQATVVVGTLAPDVRYQGNFALKLMNYILGGGSFNSRLMREIRVKRGLAYSVASILRNRNNTGIFLAYAQSENKSIDTVLSIINENIENILNDSVTERELNWAKKSKSNSYIFKFDSPENILYNYIDIIFNNLPKDYYSTYLKNITNVTEHDILGESKKLFDNGFIKVIVGRDDIKHKLTKIGTVVELN